MKRRVVVLSAITAVVITGLLLARGGESPADATPEATESAVPTSPAIEAAAAFVLEPPVPQAPEAPSADAGLEQTEDDARVAAVRLLEATESIVQLSPAEAAAMQRSMSTRRSGDRLAAEVGDQMTDLVAAAPAGITLWVTPLSARSTETDNGFDVSVWYAEVLAIDSTSVVDNWRTVTYSLVWEDGEWKVDDMASLPGPVPTRSTSLTPTSASAVVAILDGFSDDGLTP